MKKILIVDDEPDIRKTLGMVFSGSSYAVLEAADGSEGLAVARSESPDLVFLDIAMPEMDGMTALEALKLQRPELPVIMLTGEMDLGKARATLEHGATMYVTKPFDPRYLREQVDRLLGAAGAAPNDKPWRIA